MMEYRNTDLIAEKLIVHTVFYTYLHESSQLAINIRYLFNSYLLKIRKEVIRNPMSKRP